MYSLPNYTKAALDTLKNAGFEAYVVGGCVRDMLLGRTPDDYDITTNALPEDIVGLFKRTVLSGVKHGTVTAIIDKKPIEITTFRSDGRYTDHRKPDSVSFLKSIDGDLARRDFTVNAMAFDGKNTIIDLFGGKKDLEDKIIRAVGNPWERFTEDALRILRALRFASKLDFEIEENTLSALKEKAYLLKEVSRERIFAEISKILTSSNPKILEILINCGGMEFLGISKEENLSVLNAIPNDLQIRFYEFCSLTKTPAQNLCKELKTDGELLKYCKNLDLLFALKNDFDRKGIKTMLYHAGKKATRDYLILKSKESLPILDDILNSHEPYLIKDLDINGNDLLSLGISGEDVGKVLKKILFEVIENPSLNEKNRIIASLNL